MVCPMACIRWGLPMPTPPYRKHGWYALEGCSATARDAVQPGRLEPSCEGVDADPGFDMVQKRLPGICCFAANLGCCSHRRERKSCTISTDVQNLWKEGPNFPRSSGFGMLAHAGRFC